MPQPPPISWPLSREESNTKQEAKDHAESQRKSQVPSISWPLPREIPEEQDQPVSPQKNHLPRPFSWRFSQDQGFTRNSQVHSCPTTRASAHGRPASWRFSQDVPFAWPTADDRPVSFSFAACPELQLSLPPDIEPTVSRTTEDAEKAGIEDEDAAELPPVVSAAQGQQGVSGWRLVVIVFCLCFGLLLSTLETTIVATALVSISSQFKSYRSANWIVVAYLLTYTGFLVVYARTSDIFGRKNAFLVALSFFTIFSLVCGLAQSMNSLIILRAFQGIGGSGIYSMVFVIVPEAVPAKSFGLVSGLIGATFATSSILGPILGGIIVNTSSWRWVFLLNVPCASMIIVVFWFAYPTSQRDINVRNALRQLDWPGAILSIAGSVILVFALEEGGSSYPWKSGTIIASLTASGLCWIGFVVWEANVINISWLSMIPIFPLRLLRKRVLSAAFLCAFLTGFPFMVTIVNLPQRFQIVNGMTPVAAGIRMLPLLLFSALGSGLGGVVSGKRNISFYMLVASNALEVVGIGLMSQLPTDLEVPARQYGFQIILGLGFGLGLGSLVIVSRVEVSSADSAVTMGAITQVRVLGGCVGLGIATAVFTRQTTVGLEKIFSAGEIAGILSSTSIINSLPSAKIIEVRELFGGAFNNQLRIMTFVAVAAFVASIATFNKHPRSLVDVKNEQLAAEAERNGVVGTKPKDMVDEKNMLNSEGSERQSQETTVRGNSSGSEDLLKKPESAKSFK